VLGELPRSVVGWDRVRRVLDATARCPYGSRSLDGSAPAALEVRALALLFDA
jgi:hypothetical protein